jgi:hypothetical protein
MGYISKAKTGKLEQWRLHILEIPTEPPTADKSFWEEAPELSAEFDPILAKIDELARARLTTLMVAADYLKRRIAPL